MNRHHQAIRAQALHRGVGNLSEVAAAPARPGIGLEAGKNIQDGWSPEGEEWQGILDAGEAVSDESSRVFAWAMEPEGCHVFVQPER